jgi:hypothetical protein
MRRFQGKRRVSEITSVDAQIARPRRIDFRKIETSRRAGSWVGRREGEAADCDGDTDGFVYLFVHFGIHRKRSSSEGD